MIAIAFNDREEALDAVFRLLQDGEVCLAAASFLSQIDKWEKQGIVVLYIDMGDTARLMQAITENTKLLLWEPPAGETPLSWSAATSHCLVCVFGNGYNIPAADIIINAEGLLWVKDSLLAEKLTLIHQDLLKDKGLTIFQSHIAKTRKERLN